MEAALTTTERTSTVRWFGSGKQDGKAYVRNQRLKAPQESPPAPNLSDMGWVVARTCMTVVVLRGTPRPIDVVGLEAMAKFCGVAMAMLQGHSWAPTPSKGSRVNVGTISPVPLPLSSVLIGGRVRRRPESARWGGGPVVVRDRESRLHGEGVQRVRSIDAYRGGRW